jgi:hypothetical protein
LGAWIDETPPKALPKKKWGGKYKEQNGKIPCPRRQNYHLRQSTTMEHQVPKPPPIPPISISNKEREGPPILKKKKNKLWNVDSLG